MDKLTTTATEDIFVKKLGDYWGSISEEQRKNIGMIVAFTISMNGNSENLIQIFQHVTSIIVLHNNELHETLGLYSQLSVDTQQKIRAKLCEYFLSRNQ